MPSGDRGWQEGYPSLSNSQRLASACQAVEPVVTALALKEAGALPLLAIPGPRQEDPHSEHAVLLGNEPAFTSPPLSLPKRCFCDQGHQLNVRALKRCWQSNPQRFSPEYVIATDLCNALLLLLLLRGVELYVIICQPRDGAPGERGLCGH